MILEIANPQVRKDQEAAFQAAFSVAQGIIASIRESPQYSVATCHIAFMRSLQPRCTMNESTTRHAV